MQFQLRMAAYTCSMHSARHHVCRSTFAAELHSQLSELLEIGSLLPPMEACLDARSVFDAATAPHASVPADVLIEIALGTQSVAHLDGMNQGLLIQTSAGSGSNVGSSTGFEALARACA